MPSPFDRQASSLINVLIVDDSTCITLYLSALFASDPVFRVIGTARNGSEAIRMAGVLKPDVISMDINMPDMNGLDATREIMSTHPTPIVIVSSIYDRQAVTMSFKSLEAGALAILPLPPAMESPDYPKLSRELLQTFKAMAGVKLVRRSPSAPTSNITAALQHSTAMPDVTGRAIRLLAIGASTGGPQVIQEILRKLTPAITPPIVIVQHITPGFESGLAAWLDQSTGFEVSVAVGDESIKAGSAYIAPNGTHLEVNREGRIVLITGPKEHGVCPSVSRFFRSVAAAYGSAAIGVILTGMGRDGAAELKALRDRGGITIAQDRESSVVHGMPGEAIRLGGACHVLSVAAIPSMLNNFMARDKQHG